MFYQLTYQVNLTNKKMKPKHKYTRKNWNRLVRSMWDLGKDITLKLK